MRKRMTVAGVGLLGVCLVGYAALAWGQASPNPTAPPSPGATFAQLSDANGTKQPVSPMRPLAPIPGPTAPTYPPSPPPTAGPNITPSLPSTPPVVDIPVSPTPPAPVVPQPSPVQPAPTAAPEVLPLIPARAAQPQPAVQPPRAQPQTQPQGYQQTQPATQPTSGLKPVGMIEESKVAEPPLTPDAPMGRQEPAVSVEWVGPAAAKVGVTQDYALALRNTSNTPVQEVMVRVSLPHGVRIEAAEPKAETENNVYVWRLGTMMPRTDKTIQVKLNTEVRGEATPKAWVTFTGMSVLRIKVREPKLLLQVAAQDKVMVGDAAAFALTVSNPGDGSADQVKIHAKLTDGLEHGRGNEVNFEIGNLAAGETRSVQLICGTRGGGAQRVDCLAEAEGGLTAAGQANVNIILPRLDVQLLGPGLRYLDRKALYTLRVTNPGDAPATNVTVGDVVPAGFKVLAATDGGRHDYNTRTVSWFLGEIGPGQTREVKFEAQAVETGEHKHKARAVGARGLAAECELTTRVDGISELVLDLTNTENPIEVGAETAYEIHLTNTGSKTESDIHLVAAVPDKMDFKSAVGPAAFHQQGKTIVFDPIDKLAPRGEITFKITAKALEPGTVRFKAQVSSANLTEPVIKTEATRIYSDTPEGKVSPPK